MANSNIPVGQQIHVNPTGLANPETGFSNEYPPTTWANRATNPALNSRQYFTDLHFLGTWDGSKWVNISGVGNWYGFKSILIGDSHLARGIGTGGTAGTAGTVVSDGTIVTFTTTATHYLAPGNRCTIMASNTGASAGLHDGLVVEVLSVSDTTHFTIAAQQSNFYFSAGDWSVISGGGWVINRHHHSQDYGFFPWFNAYLGSPFITVGAYCLGGTASTRWTAIVDNIKKGQQIDYGFICIGYNDLSGSSTADTVFANTLTLANAVSAAGGIPVIFVPPPFNNDVVGYSTAKGVEFGRLHRLLIDLGRVDRSIVVLDLFGTCVDGQSATGNYKTGYDDPTSHAHVNINYCGVVGKALATQMLPYLPPIPDIFPMSRLDDYSSGATAKNRIPNGLMAGGGVGTLPTNWLNSGSTTAVTTTGNHSQISGYGWGCQQAIVASAGSQDLNFRNSYSRLSGTNWYIAGLEIEVLAAPSKLQSMAVNLLNSGTGYDIRAIWGSHSSQSGADIQLTIGDKLRIITPPMIDVSGAAGTQQLQFRPFWSAAGSGDFAIGRAFVYTVDSPYLSSNSPVKTK